MNKYLFSFIFLWIAQTSLAQIKFNPNSLGIGTSSGTISYSRPQEYEIANIEVSGTRFLDKNALVNLSGLVVGEKIMVPGDKISSAIEKMWKQGLFEDVQVKIEKTEGSKIYLNLYLQESPRLTRYSITGVRKGQADEIKGKINLTKGKILTQNLLNTTKYKILKYYKDKGYYNASVTTVATKDSVLSNGVVLKIKIDKNERVKINDVIINGNKAINTKKVQSFLKGTKKKQWFNVFRNSKYDETKYTEDKQKIVEKYNALGYRDARIISDSVYQHNEKTLNVEINLTEGNQYYFGNISFSGNSKYTADYLSKILNIKKGDIYDQGVLDKRISQSPTQQDIASLYLDDGYLFFQANPVETKVYNDTIDLEIRIYEGQQATVNRIIIKGNDKTNDKVIMREIRTQPGQKFSRAEIIRTQRELSTLGYFDPEKIGIQPKPNPADGTVDIEYTVVEKPSDQIELSGGYGGGFFVGTLGLSFNNFSARNIFNGKAWNPLPAGDGQKLSIRGQSSGLFYQGLNLSFSEPWLGGKKPNYFSVSVFANVRRQGAVTLTSSLGQLVTRGGSIGLGKRLKFPDDYFVLNSTINVIEYNLNNFPGFAFSDGNAFNINLTEVLSRNSLDQLIYPRSGANIALTLQSTLPYSLFNGKDYSGLSVQQKFKFLEYNKIKFDLGWYNRIVGNMVLYTHIQSGFLGYYNSKVGLPPFERYRMGGTGQFGFDFSGTTEFIPLRGYQDNTLLSEGQVTSNIGNPIFTRYVMELRQPLTLNQTASIFVLGFAEAGNLYSSFSNYNPYNLRRSAGFGIRIFLPVFGKLGLDYGFGFDKTNASDSKGQFHFSINQEF